MKSTIPLMLALTLAACCRSSHPGAKGYEQYDRRSNRSSSAPSGVLDLRTTMDLAWCSGMEPDPSQWPRTVPWSGTMYMRAAHPDSTGRTAINNVKDKRPYPIATDSTGHGHLLLPAGNYILLDEDRKDRTRYEQLLRDFGKPTLHRDAIDKACLDRWSKGPFEVITITAGDTVHMELKLQDKCSWERVPCAAYHGPLPP